MITKDKLKMEIIDQQCPKMLSDRLELEILRAASKLEDHILLHPLLIVDEVYEDALELDDRAKIRKWRSITLITKYLKLHGYTVVKNGKSAIDISWVK